MERREAHRRKFCAALPSDGGRCSFSGSKLGAYIGRIVAAKTGRKKNPADYALLKRYDVATLGDGQTILIKKNSLDPYVRYIPVDEIFDRLYDAHVEVCHGGQKRTHREVKKTVANITREQVALFLSYCVICEERKTIKKRRRMERPIVSNEYGERGQVDLIDMRSCRTPEGYCYILQYQDHFTKFSVLRALRSKRAEEVAEEMFDILTLIGAPKILQSDNGAEFVGSPLVDMIKKHWPTTKFVHGSPRYPQSQGSVERANGDVKRMLCGIMRERDTCNWATLLRKVQWTKNTVEHRVIGTTPYESLFGQAPVSSMKIAERVSDCHSFHFINL